MEIVWALETGLTLNIAVISPTSLYLQLIHLVRAAQSSLVYYNSIFPDLSPPLILQSTLCYCQSHLFNKMWI